MKHFHCSWALSSLLRRLAMCLFWLSALHLKALYVHRPWWCIDCLVYDDKSSWDVVSKRLWLTTEITRSCLEYTMFIKINIQCKFLILFLSPYLFQKAKPEGPSSPWLHFLAGPHRPQHLSLPGHSCRSWEREGEGEGEREGEREMGILQPWERPVFGAGGALLGDSPGNWKCTQGTQREMWKGFPSTSTPASTQADITAVPLLLCVCACVFGTRDGWMSQSGT